MKNIRIFYLQIFNLFGGKILNIFELACFRNDSQDLNQPVHLFCLIRTFTVSLHNYLILKIIVFTLTIETP